jgi:hypothetical protein
MRPRMSKSELALFFSFITHAETYVEFGCGGSTFLASHYVKKSVVSVDSSYKWIELTAKQCIGGQTEPFFYQADIGDTGEWGTPTNDMNKDKWPNYHSDVWGLKQTWSADLYFIDGRFRVACFAQIYRRATKQSIIGIHDFMSRQRHYGIVRELGREIASVDDISFFLPLPDRMALSQDIIDKYRFNYK